MNPIGSTNLVFPLHLKPLLWPSHAFPFHSVRRCTLYKTLWELLRDVLREKGKFHDVNNPASNVNRQNKILVLTDVINNQSRSPWSKSFCSSTPEICVNEHFGKRGKNWVWFEGSCKSPENISPPISYLSPMLSISWRYVTTTLSKTKGLKDRKKMNFKCFSM